jgi:IclR family mhp operon transcriptional activator
MNTRYHQVRSLEKGLRILCCLSAGGESSIIDLAEATDIPRPTVHRLVDTLINIGYVSRGRRPGLFRLTGQVRNLAAGYRESDQFLDIADPILAKLGDDIVWPTDIATYDDLGMVIRTSTHQRSPMSLHGATTGARFPMLLSSIGLTYLAFCPETEQRTIIRSLKAKGLANDLGEVEIRKILSQAKARGYALRHGQGDARTSSISVPIMRGKRVMACLCIVWIHSALPVSAAVNRYLGTLQDAARDIEESWRTRQKEKIKMSSI